MSERGVDSLTCSAKLARIVLKNCGPLSAPEVASEAYLSPAKAARGIDELERRGLVEPVCGVCRDREVVYALTPAGEAVDPSP